MSEKTLKLTPTESVTVRGSSPEALEVEGVYGPRGKPPPPHFHPSQDESFEVLEGALRTRVAGEERDLKPGEVLEIPRGTEHQMWNPSEQTARVRWTTAPRLRTEEWFGAIDRLHREGRVGRKGMPGPLAFGVLLSEYDDVFRLGLKPKILIAPLLGAPRRRRAAARRLPARVGRYFFFFFFLTHLPRLSLRPFLHFFFVTPGGGGSSCPAWSPSAGRRDHRGGMGVGDRVREGAARAERAAVDVDRPGRKTWWSSSWATGSSVIPGRGELPGRGRRTGRQDAEQVIRRTAARQRRFGSPRRRDRAVDRRRVTLPLGPGSMLVNEGDGAVSS